jgi:malonate decarboxylase alpha subunit
MTVQTSGPALSSWTTRRDEKQRGMQLVQPWMKGPVLSSAKVVEALETLLSAATELCSRETTRNRRTSFRDPWVKVDPRKLHDLHLIIRASVGQNISLCLN